MYQKFAQNTKIVLKKGIDNEIEQSDDTIISGRGDSIYALRGGENNVNFFEEKYHD